VQAAMEWIFEHMDDEDIDVPSHTPATTPTPSDAPPKPASSDAPSSTSSDADAKPKTVHNALCDECQQQIVGIRYKATNRPNYDLCEACKAKGHGTSLEFEAHTEDIVNPSLTPEERAAQVEKLNQRIAAIRAKKAEDEAHREKEREIMRRKGGKEAIEAKKKWEDDQARREDEKRKKEKEDERKAKERIKQKIEQDRMERAAKNRKEPATATTATTSAAPAPATQAPSQQKSYNEAQVQMRLTDGSTIKATFLPTDTLHQVFAYVETNRTDGRGAFSLMTTFPRKVYTKSDANVTLQEAGLVPNGTLVVAKV